MRSPAAMIILMLVLCAGRGLVLRAGHLHLHDERPVAATMVEEGLIAWQTTIAESFPDLRAVMDARYAHVTLEMLLAHRAGIVDHTNSWSYSNFGYAIAGVMLERAASEPYESLVRRRIAEPLVLPSLGFGPPATPGTVDQPWGHVTSLIGFLPIAPRPESDNPPAIAPAGTVHLSILDLARYAAMHLHAARGEPTLIASETAAVLYRPRSKNGYALGWLSLAAGADGNTDGRACGGPVMLHNGSNGSFYAFVWLAPARNVAIVLATNADGDRPRRAVEEAIGTLAGLAPACGGIASVSRVESRILVPEGA